MQSLYVKNLMMDFKKYVVPLVGGAIGFVIISEPLLHQEHLLNYHYGSRFEVIPQPFYNLPEHPPDRDYPTESISDKATFSDSSTATAKQGIAGYTFFQRIS